MFLLTTIITIMLKDHGVDIFHGEKKNHQVMMLCTSSL